MHLCLNIRLGIKCKLVTNALVFSIMASIEDFKKVIRLGSDQVIKCMLVSNAQAFSAASIADKKVSKIGLRL
jgi:hypothetical protein